MKQPTCELPLFHSWLLFSDHVKETASLERCLQRFKPSLKPRFAPVSPNLNDVLWLFDIVFAATSVSVQNTHDQKIWRFLLRRWRVASAAAGWVKGLIHVERKQKSYDSYERCRLVTWGWQDSIDPKVVIDFPDSGLACVQAHLLRDLRVL